MKVLHTHFYKFTPEGLTGYILISTSHISVHTWAELNYAACDVFSCADRKETERTVKHITEMVKHNRIKIKKMRRGFRVNC
jgi:S-adenosylmethionine decarboxylase